MNEKIAYLMKTKFELIVEEINRIDNGLNYTMDFYGDYQEVTESKAQQLYTELLVNLDMIPGLFEAEKTKLRELLKLKIKELPERAKQAELNYEDRRRVNRDQTIEKREKAWEAAKKRYESQSLLKKVIWRIKGDKTPKYYEENGDFRDIKFYDNMPIGEINKLYGGTDGREL